MMTFESILNSYVKNLNQSEGIRPKAYHGYVVEKWYGLGHRVRAAIYFHSGNSGFYDYYYGSPTTHKSRVYAYVRAKDESETWEDACRKLLKVIVKDKYFADIDFESPEELLMKLVIIGIDLKHE